MNNINTYLSKLRNKTTSEILSLIFKKIYFTFRYWLNDLYYLLNKLLPIKKNLIVFSSEGDYCDNSWALYNYIRKEYPKYICVWLTIKNKKYNNDSKTLFFQRDSLKAYRSLAIAKYIFSTHGMSQILSPRKSQLVLNLWHGIGGKAPKDGVKGHHNIPNYNYLIYMGPKNRLTHAIGVGCPERYMTLLGYPRNDLLLDNKGYGYQNPFAPEGFNGKLIIWMPTFRKSINKSLSEDIETSTGLPLMDTVDDIKSLNDFLKDENVIIMVKIHHLQAEEPIFKAKYSNLIFVTDEMIAGKGLQLYQVVAKTDALLSDYSSIATDYLLMDRPMGFILDDLKEYESHRGSFLFKDIREILAGKYIYNMDDLKQYINEIAKGIDSTKYMRDKLLPEMISYPDNHSCERICEFCEIK